MMMDEEVDDDVDIDEEQEEEDEESVLLLERQAGAKGGGVELSFVALDDNVEPSAAPSNNPIGPRNKPPTIAPAKMPAV